MVVEYDRLRLTLLPSSSSVLRAVGGLILVNEPLSLTDVFDKSGFQTRNQPPLALRRSRTSGGGNTSPSSRSGSLFVISSAITEFSNPLTPSFVTAFLEFRSHKQFHLFLADPVFGLNITKANMIGQGHAYDLADVFRGECF